MTLPNANFTDIIVTTLQGYSGNIADNITKNNALLFMIDKRGNKKYATGRSIVQELEYAENSTTQWYSGYDILDVSPSDTFTAAEFAYKQLAGNVVISGLEQIQNSGQEAMKNLLSSRLKNLKSSLQNSMATGLFATGTANDGKELGGLRLLISDTGSGTVGGIDSSVNTFWANKYDSTSALSSTNAVTKFNKMYNKLVRGMDKPDIIVAHENHYNAFFDALTASQRFTNNDLASAGFTTLEFRTCPVVLDENCPSNHTYFVNSKYLFLRPSKGREFVALGEKASINQDALVVPMVWAGNMTVSNRALQGVILNP